MYSINQSSNGRYKNTYKITNNYKRQQNGTKTLNIHLQRAGGYYSGFTDFKSKNEIKLLTLKFFILFSCFFRLILSRCI